jgi:hypothetical protein
LLINIYQQQFSGKIKDRRNLSLPLGYRYFCCLTHIIKVFPQVMCQKDAQRMFASISLYQKGTYEFGV